MVCQGDVSLARRQCNLEVLICIPFSADGDLTTVARVYRGLPTCKSWRWKRIPYAACPHDRHAICTWLVHRDPYVCHACVTHRTTTDTNTTTTSTTTTTTHYFYYYDYYYYCMGSFQVSSSSHRVSLINPPTTRGARRRPLPPLGRTQPGAQLGAQGSEDGRGEASRPYTATLCHTCGTGTAYMADTNHLTALVVWLLRRSN